jgi:hypothetical protein
VYGIQGRLDVGRPLREQVGELSSPTTRNGTSGRRAVAARIVSTPWRGINLPTKRTRNGSGVPSGPEQWFVGADEGNGDTLGREVESLPEVGGVRRGVGDDEIGASERDVVDAAEDARRRGAGRSAPCRRPACRAARRAG